MTIHCRSTRRSRSAGGAGRLALAAWGVAALCGLPAALPPAYASEAPTGIPALEQAVRARPDPDRAIAPRDPLLRPGESIALIAPGDPPEARRMLLDATRRNDMEQLRKLLSEGANPNTATAAGDRPLSIAVENQQLEMVRLLLLAGARPDFRGASGLTPLGSAILRDDAPTVEALLRAGADPELRGANSNTALNDAIMLSRTSIGLRLIRAGADTEAADRLGRRSVAGAAATGNLTLLAALLDAGVDPDQRDRANRSPVYWAHPAVRDPIIALLEQARQRTIERRASVAGVAAP